MSNCSLRSPLALGALACCLLAACSERAGKDGGGEPSALPARLPSYSITFPSVGFQPGLMRIEPAFPNLAFRRPVQITHAGDGTDRLFVVDQIGEIAVFPNAATVTGAQVFLDISSKVRQTGEETGLLGLAFHPGYAQNGRFYVSYFKAAPQPSTMVLAEYRVSQANPNAADPSSERVLLDVPQPEVNHNGGSIAFGPDGMLYASFGDGGGQGHDPNRNGQDRRNLHSTIIRIDPLGSSRGRAYAIPADNPFVGTGGGVRPEIWAYGLRNPWRMSFDRLNGELWVGDVGSWRAEEIDLVRKGGNYGWSIYEGSTPVNMPDHEPSPSAFDAPIHAYDQSFGRCVIGGHVYRGVKLPFLRGMYVFGDYVSGLVFGLVRAPTGKPVVEILGVLRGLSSFGEDESGELYAVTLAGTIHRLASQKPGPAFPVKLSETKLFEDLAKMVPVPGLLEYDVLAPLWSDAASKRRFIAVPGARQIEFDPDEAWRFPLGTVLVKHFELEMEVGKPSSRRRLETRALVREEAGWSGYTYVWNAAQQDADLLTLPRGLDVTFTIKDPASAGGQRDQKWHFPSMSECMQCHTRQRGHVLGVRTRQLNLPPHMRGTRIDHLERWNAMRLFKTDIGSTAQYGHYFDPADTTRTLAERARSYLAANCAHCHMPGGSTQAQIDLRFRTPDRQMNAIDVRPMFSWVGIPNAYIIKKNDKTRSVLWERLHRLDEARMPRIGSNLVDDLAVDLIGKWIDALP